VAYSLKARALRRCRATTKRGTPCKCWAMWGFDICSAHAAAAGIRLARHPRFTIVHARYPNCTCAAWPFPHRPGSGDCRWPDPYPEDPQDV
jgi:hypothetical protein